MFVILPLCKGRNEMNIQDSYLNLDLRRDSWLYSQDGKDGVILSPVNQSKTGQSQVSMSLFMS